jgi:hypothetical protein
LAKGQKVRKCKVIDAGIFVVFKSGERFLSSQRIIQFGLFANDFFVFTRRKNAISVFESL